jgi:hypothetical protein
VTAPRSVDSVTGEGFETHLERAPRGLGRVQMVPVRGAARLVLRRGAAAVTGGAS